MIQPINGRFQKGEHRSPSTEFQKGQHWRPPKPYWDKEWLYNEYVVRGRSSEEIAEDWGIGDTAILFWLKKLGIPTRTMNEARSVKHWGASGEENGMFGKIGEQSSNWKGGLTPERQAFYGTPEWKAIANRVWRRDRGICRICGITKKDGVKLHIHHIISFQLREYRLLLDNLVLLCVNCHHWVHSSKNTDRMFIGEGG